jgi:hypothetical protein
VRAGGKKRRTSAWKARGWIAALSLLAVAGCADVWGLKDLSVGDDGGDAGGLDATMAASDAGETSETDGTTPAGDDGGNCGATGPLGTILNCGACGNACDNTNSLAATCVDGKCTYGRCADGWQNCDTSGSDTNGCESSTTSIQTCGACDVACDTKNSVGTQCGPSPDGGIGCSYSGCQTGFADCNPSWPNADGCETSLATAANCGSCGNKCDTVNSQNATCPHGTTCIYSGCNPGFADCDTSGADTNGCEKAVATNTCDVCNGTSCDTATSVGEVCEISDAGASATCKYMSCDPGYANCNTTPPDTNGCETSLSTAANCGACGKACDTLHSTAASCTGSSTSSSCTYGGCQPGWLDCAQPNGNFDGCESSQSSTSSCGGCHQACSTITGAARCDGTTCSYTCNAGRVDCNAATAPDTDGCECATPGCCSSGACQTIHSNGTGQNFYDCNAPATHTAAAAAAACGAFGGGSSCKTSSVCCGGLSALGLCLGTTDSSVCGSAGGTCHCWQYSGTNPGTVQNGCSAACGAASDPTWN